MEGDAQQSTLGAEVDGEVEHRVLNLAVDDALDLAGVLLDDEQIVAAEEGDARRGHETVDHGSDIQLRMEHRRLLGEHGLRAGQDQHQHGYDERDEAAHDREPPFKGLAGRRC